MMQTITFNVFFPLTFLYSKIYFFLENIFGKIKFILSQLYYSYFA